MREDQGFYIADSPDDFKGFNILYIEYWKENIRRVWMTKENAFYEVFSDVKFTRDLVEQNKEN